MATSANDARKEDIYRLLGTSAYTQAEVAEKLRLSKSTVSKYANKLVDEGRLVPVPPFKHDGPATKRYSSYKMVDIQPASMINVDADYLLEQFIDYVRRYFPEAYNNERELTHRVERAVKAVVNFPLIPDETNRLLAADSVKEYFANTISDLTDLLQLLKAFAAIDLKSRAVHPIVRTSEGREIADVITERVDSGIAGAKEPQGEDG